MTIVLVLGGAGSGKSAFAEALVEQCPQSARERGGKSGCNRGCSPIYIATAQALDEEMKSRIEKHRARRAGNWDLAEEESDLCGALARAGERAQEEEKGARVLVDCLTLWMSNLMLKGADLERERRKLAQCLSDMDKRTYIALVSNEIGHSIVPMEKTARDFRDHIGLLHQEIAAIADNVWFVIAGIGQKLK